MSVIDGSTAVDRVFDILMKILVHEMDLDPGRIWVFNPEFKIPSDQGMFIVLECFPTKVISSRNVLATSGAFTETQEMSTLEQINIMVFSKNFEAMQRKEEVIMAMVSTYAQQIQESNSIKINRIMPIQDLSMLEGGALLYRYDILVSLFAWYSKTKAVDYYDTFPVKTRINDGSPDLVTEFNQPTTDPTA